MAKSTIGIVDYNTGNITSIKNAFEKIGISANVFSNPEDIFLYDKVVLPGVGAFGDAMKHLLENNMDKAIKEYANSGSYILGICLGAQVLFQKGYEFGEHNGLGLLKGEVKPFDKTKMNNLKIPHMGWNSVNIKQNPLLEGLGNDIYLYFVHSFYMQCDKDVVIGDSNYGYNFASIVNKDNIYGMQPHPEKSHNNGLKILDNFSKL